MKRNVVTLLFCVYLITGTNDSFSCEGLDFFEQRIRPALSGMEITAGYFSVINRSQQALKITSLNSATLRSVTLHETIYENGLVKMRPVPSLIIPPKTTVRAEPGGLHLMLEGNLSALDKAIDIEFSCEAESRTIEFPFTPNNFRSHDS